MRVLIAIMLSLPNILFSGPVDETERKDQTGVVKSANQPIPGATVSATQGATLVVTTTDQNGIYSIQLGPGQWLVEVTMVGFQPAKKALTVSNASQKLDFTLQLKQAPVAAPSSSSAGTRSSEQSRNERAPQIENELENNRAQPVTPVENGDDSNEAFLVSGTLYKGASPNAAPGSSSPQSGLAGQPAGQGGGTQNLNTPGFGDSGRSSRWSASRARVDSAAARQAGNRRQASQLHGTLTLRVENSELNAKPFSITGQDTHQPAYAQSRSTFAVGGPLTIPKIFKDPATFFFLNYSGTRYRNPYTAVETVPTELERQGDFSQSIQVGGPVQIYDPATRQPFLGNVIPANRIDPIARKLLTYFPHRTSRDW